MKKQKTAFEAFFLSFSLGAPECSAVARKSEIELSPAKYQTPW